MGLTSIEWCDLTFNPWHGCQKVSPGCAHCYAEPQAMRFSGSAQLWGEGHAFRFFGDKHWSEPLSWARTFPGKLGRRPRVFCASMADVFEEHPALDEPRRRLFDLIAETPELDWLVLTKRPEAARDWMTSIARITIDGAVVSESRAIAPYPANVWLGVSIENARFTWRADVLREIPAAVRFISAEPLLGSLFKDPTRGATRRPADPVGRAAAPGTRGQGAESPNLGLDGGKGSPASANDGEQGEWRNRSSAPLDLADIDWLIIGGESGPKARPFRLEHVRELIHAADAETRRRGLGARPVATFVKQLGARPTFEDDLTIGVYKTKTLKLCDRKGGDWSEWPGDLRIREFPRSVSP